MVSETQKANIALVGLGSIGISFAALYLKYSNAQVSVYDPRPDLEEHVRTIMPGYLSPSGAGTQVDQDAAMKRLRVCASLKDACAGAFIVQEQGPENLAFKQDIWTQIIPLVSEQCHLWSSTSGIAASRQVEALSESAKQRLMVVHPFNPPHIMPLIEIVPSPHTNTKRVDFAKQFFEDLDSGHQPVVIRKEVPGFVGNRLAFALFREACHLVSEDVVSVEDVDKVVEASLGPRWAVTGPFRSYHYGGGTRGLGAFFQNLSGTMKEIAEQFGQEEFSEVPYNPGNDAWADKVVKQCNEIYGLPTTKDFQKRDEGLKKVLLAKGTRTG